MKVEVKKEQDAKCTLEVIIESAKVDEVYDKHLKNAAKNMAIPGFRKGKAPIRYAEKYINKNLIMQHVLEELGPSALQDAMSKEALTPLNEPSMEIVQIEKGKDLILKATFEVKPEVHIEDYTGWEIVQEKAEIKDEDIENTLNLMRENAAQYIEIEEDRGLEKGDFAVVDFESYHEGKPVEKGMEKNYLVELREEAFIPGFVDNLVGLKKGEEKEFQITFPSEYPTELKGKVVDFKFRILGIKKKVLHEINDDFAKEVSKYGTLEELRQHVREEFCKRIDAQAKAGVEEQIKDRVIKKVNVTLPETLISYEQQVILDGLRRNLAAEGMSLDDYVKYQKTDLASIINTIRPRAERLGKLEMALEAISKNEKLVVEDSEVEEKIKEFADQLRQEPAKLKETLQKEGRIAALRYELLKQKTLDFLVANSKVTYVPPGSSKGQGKELEKETDSNLEKVGSSQEKDEKESKE